MVKKKKRIIGSDKNKILDNNFIEGNHNHSRYSIAYSFHRQDWLQDGMGWDDLSFRQNFQILDDVNPTWHVFRKDRQPRSTCDLTLVRVLHIHSRPHNAINHFLINWFPGAKSLLLLVSLVSGSFLFFLSLSQYATLDSKHLSNIVVIVCLSLFFSSFNKKERKKISYSQVSLITVFFLFFSWWTFLFSSLCT